MPLESLTIVTTIIAPPDEEPLTVILNLIYITRVNRYFTIVNWPGHESRLCGSMHSPTHSRGQTFGGDDK